MDGQRKRSLSLAGFWLTAVIFVVSGVPVGQPTPPEIPRVPVYHSTAVAPWRPPASTPRGLTDGAHRVGRDIRVPRKTRHVDPIYPPQAQASSVEGTVIVEIRIDETGIVSEAHVVQSVALLDQAALDAVRQWRFTPTFLNNTPVPVVMTAAVSFDLR
jgi:TonB family protein